MNQNRYWRVLGPLFGVAATILFMLGLTDIFKCLACEVSINSAPEEFARVFAEARQGIWLANYLSFLGTFCFFWFAGFLRHELQSVEGEDGWLSSVAFAGAVVTGALASALALLSLASVVVADYDVSPEVARTLFVLGFESGQVFAPPLAALVGATSVVILQHRWLPKPIGWLGPPIAIFPLVPLDTPGLAVGIAVLWLFLLAMMLLWRSVRAGA